jgi:hypothetical protein
MNDVYAKCECAICHKIVPKNHAFSVQIERKTGRSSGSWRFYEGRRHGTIGWSEGRTYYRTGSAWICEQCYPRFQSAQNRKALVKLAVWACIIGVVLVVHHAAQVSNVSSDNTATTASVPPKGDLLMQPVVNSPVAVTSPVRKSGKTTVPPHKTLRQAKP